MAQIKKNPIATLKAQAKEFDFNKLRAAEDNKGANSGETMYLDFHRMNFVINEKKIDKTSISTLTERAWKQYSFREAITPFDEKTHKYEKGSHSSAELVPLLQKEVDENKNYRPIAKEIFKEMFEYVGAEVPSDSILEELITNCNQAGYGAGTFNEFHAALSSFGLTSHNPKKALNIYYIDHNHIKIKSDMAIPITTFDNPEEKICDLPSSLEFTLESQDGKDGVEYKDGKLSLTIPKELGNHKEGSKSLFDIIKEHFQKFCEKLGFKFETETQIKHNLENPLKVNSHLESVELPVHDSRGL